MLRGQVGRYQICFLLCLRVLVTCLRACVCVMPIIMYLRIYELTMVHEQPNRTAAPPRHASVGVNPEYF